MRTAFDLSPLFRSSVGFDRVFDLLESARVTASDNWPPYDIIKKGDDDYRITMAVAGFSQEDLNITHERNMLLVSGQRNVDDDNQYLHRGIAGRAFERRFELADHVKVTGASLVNGLLTIDLKREIPEEMKPRRIEIAGAKSPARVEARQVDSDKQAA